MLAAVKIKEEPLDEIEESQEIFKHEDVLMKQKINGGLPTLSNSIHIVEEQDSIITVSAAEMRSEDEMRFMDSLNNTDPNKFNGICSKCLKSFTNYAQFLKHTRRNHCVTKQKCPICPVTFVDASSMFNHLNLHRENHFFCSQHCGANYETLPLCEYHERMEHKIESTSKLDFNQFCSFCRKGFKSEVQLHVHWFQQTQHCGKLMQDIIIHSTNLSKIYNDKDLKTSKNLLLDNQLNSPTTNTVANIPITKLRLKYDTSPTKKTTNKRQPTNYDEEIDNKRLKVIENIKMRLEANQLPFNYNADMQIKEEPEDDYDDIITSNLVPEVIIKTEEDTIHETQEVNKKPHMKNLVINNNMIGPDSIGKFIPLDHLVSAENANKADSSKEMTTFSLNTPVNANIQNNDNKIIGMDTKNLPILKIVNNNNNINNINLNNNTINTPIKTEGGLRLFKITPIPNPNPFSTPNTTFANLNFANVNFNSGKQMSKFANGQNLNDGDIKLLPKSGLQIIKLLPNAQFNNNNKPPLILKLKPQSMPAQTGNPIPIPNPTIPILASATPIKQAYNATTISPINKTATAVSIKLNSLEQNTTIDAEDFKKLQTEALIKAEEHHKNLYIPKTRLMMIENIPEKKQIIDNMKQKIAEVKDKTTEQIQGKPAGNFVLNTKSDNGPPTFYLPVLTSNDVELVETRYKYPNYNYKWICPYCRKEYEIKSALKMHLFKSHNLTTRDMDKINVQALPYIMEELTEPTEEIKPVDIKTEAIVQDTDSQSQATSETDSSTTTSTLSPNQKQLSATKHQRQRYSCDKCGRTCSSKTMLKDHISSNCSRDPQYPCQQCPKKFYSHGTLQSHMSIHTGELPFKCDYCDDTFRTRGQVKVHHRTHTKEKPFHCQVCYQSFNHRETLIAHLSRHIGMKRYKCYGCNNQFSCISALKTHRDIRADTCGKVKFNPRAIGPRVRVIRGNVIFEAQPEINPYLKSEDPKNVLSELQNQSEDTKNVLTEVQNQSEVSKSVIFEIKKSV